MGDYGREVEFGANVDPTAADAWEAFEVARRAEEGGLELVGIQDHPYSAKFVDTWMLMATLLARTERIAVFPNVANLPLRGPMVIAKQAASLDVLSGGRFELGLGAGALWDRIEAFGGPRRTPGEAVDALEEATRLIRLFWRGERTIAFSGRFYSIDGATPGPLPAHPIRIWIGSYRPRMLALTGRLGDGWSVSVPYAPPHEIADKQRRIDEAAEEAGRSVADIRRIYNLFGLVTDGPTEGLLHGPPSHWVDQLTEFVLELGFDTFVFWPPEDRVRQLGRFAAEVAPGVREAVAARRRAAVR